MTRWAGRSGRWPARALPPSLPPRPGKHGARLAALGRDHVGSGPEPPAALGRQLQERDRLRLVGAAGGGDRRVSDVSARGRAGRGSTRDLWLAPEEVLPELGGSMGVACRGGPGRAGALRCWRAVGGAADRGGNEEDEVLPVGPTRARGLWKECVVRRGSLCSAKDTLGSLLVFWRMLFLLPLLIFRFFFSKFSPIQRELSPNDLYQCFKLKILITIYEEGAK